ncbi:GLPGLI family protein [Epilithonimonas vandammei]|uniref:GLPGLI family protein n=1 Tax=Epilithonimonas vandammei TaxID=2487072 RepID=A0A3G8ZHI7_9FLAO|nr:GLPGLI family protein [Epilithonimonas vandammei]AZI53864.1 GLPGLI family protein [Epilithonimonas vandammei]
MKKLLINLFLILGVLAIAQNKRFIYEYKFISDSTNVDDVKTEMMFLDTTKDGSKYYSYTVFNSDSIMKVDLEKQLAATGSINVKSDMRKGDVRYSVTKTYPDYKINLHRRLGMDAYNISDDRKINWKILSEKEKIGEWNAQKAEADFAGRHWIAWFTTEIPIQDGPYKFRGLPGLIVKIEDKTGSHKMELKGIKNITGNVDINVFEVKEIAVNLKQFQKVLKEYENDPTKGIKQIQMGGTSIILTGKDGTSTKIAKEQEERLKARIKKDNNRIELDIVK